MRKLRRKRSPACERVGAWIAILVLVAQAQWPSMVAASRVAAAPPASLTELILCTSDGIRRTALADGGGDRQPRSAPAMFCPLCLAAQSMPAVPPPVGGVASGILGFDTLAEPPPAPQRRPTCSADPPPARGPPIA